MEKRELLYEGKTKRVYSTDDTDLLIVDFKDETTAFDGEKRAVISGKGAVNNLMTNQIFKMLEEQGIPTHYIQELSDQETVIKKAEMIPLEFIIRNFAAGSFAEKFKIREGEELLDPTCEIIYKNPELSNPEINEYHAVAMGIVTRGEIDKITRMAFTMNEILTDYFLDKNIRLVDFKLEFGYYKDQIILADEISPDTCRLWDYTTGEKMDKDRFRQGLGEVEDAYRAVAKRLGLSCFH